MSAADGTAGVSPPLSNIETEGAVLGGMMLDPRAASVAIEGLREQDFVEPLHQRIFATISAEAAAGRHATPLTLPPFFQNDPAMQALGGPGYLGALTGSGAALIGLRNFIKHLRELTERRHLRDAYLAGADQATDLNVDKSAIIDGVDHAMAQTVEVATGVKPIGVGAAWDRTMAAVRAVGEGTAPRGVRVAGLPEWDEIVGGMHAGQMVLLGARPGMGKTALALRVARGAAENGHGVLFISREMPVEQLMLRLVADLLFEAGSYATFTDVLEGHLNARDYLLAQEIRDRIESWPLTFEEPPRLNAARVAPMIRRHQRAMANRDAELRLVVVDYLGLLDPPTPRGNREQETSDISRELKNAARAGGVALLALAQLNRGVEQREDKRPLLSDLRDSGSLEQDADTVAFAYRAEYYLRQVEPDALDVKKRDSWEVEMAAERDRLEIYSAKVRQGEPQRRKIHFFGGRQAVRGADFYLTGGGGR
jgi:replicative DNA helicase